MKKILMLTMIAFIAAGFIGCKEDETKADLQWQNTDTEVLTKIVWVNNGSVDQTWDGTFGQNVTTSPLGIKELVGTGESFIGSAPATITLDQSASTGIISASSNTAVVQENATATLVISAVAKK